MHGLHVRALGRARSLIGVVAAAAVACGLLLAQVGAAQAVSVNTISRTSITSPSDPSYFYDSTGGATGGFTVTGTTNSSQPATDAVDIDCYSDDDGGSSDGGPLVSDVPLRSDGSFSTTVPYLAIEEASGTGACRLRAVPAGTQPISGLASFAGLRVLVAWLGLSYNVNFAGTDPESGTLLRGYALWSPGLGADNVFVAADRSAPTSAPCAGVSMSLASTADFGADGDFTFYCADAFPLSVDGVTTFGPTTYDAGGTPAVTVSVSHDPSTGDVTIDETEPLGYCTYDVDYNCTWHPLGVTDDRTIQQANGGRVVLVTDTFTSTDGKSHTVVDDVNSDIVLDSYAGGGILFQFPGGSGYAAEAAGTNVPVTVPSGTIYAYNSSYPDGSTQIGRAALTYFSAPSGDGQIPAGDIQVAVSSGGDNELVIPYTIQVPKGGSAAPLSIQYSTEYSQSAFAADLATGLDLKTAPTVTIATPTAGSTQTASSVTVTGTVSATTGVRAVSVNGVNATLRGDDFSATVPLTPGANTIQATVTANSGVTTSTTETVSYDVPPLAPAISPLIQPQLQALWSGPVWRPVANTGGARSVRDRGKHGLNGKAAPLRERLHGHVIAGSAAVSYYFEYGPGRRLNRRTRSRRLGAGLRNRSVSAVISGLRAGRRYRYRLIAQGSDGRSVGRERSFKLRGRR